MLIGVHSWFRVCNGDDRYIGGIITEGEERCMNDQNSPQRFLGNIGRGATGVSPPKRSLPFKKRSCCTLHVAGLDEKFCEFPVAGFTIALSMSARGESCILIYIRRIYISESIIGN